MNRPDDYQTHSLAGDAQVSCCGSVAKSFLTLCDLMDCSTPGYPVLHYLLEFAQIDSSVHGILQAKILEWVAIPFSRGSSWPRNQTQVSYIAGRFLTVLAPGKPLGKGRPSPVLQWSRRCCNPQGNPSPLFRKIRIVHLWGHYTSGTWIQRTDAFTCWVEGVS